MQDNSNVDENGNPIQEGDELTKERYKQIVAGKDALAEKQRNVIVTAIKEKELGKTALRAYAEAEPKAFASILKETGFNSIEEYEATLKKPVPPEDEIRQAYEKFESEKQSRTAKERVENQFNSLPEDIKETAKKEFSLLTEGRNLTAEQTEQMAQKAVTLAQATHGTKHQVDFAKMSLASSGSMSSAPVTEKKKDETDTFIQGIASGNSHPFWSAVLPPNQ